jgi:CubicO group peptidase (beta-lactamase class C family)
MARSFPAGSPLAGLLLATVAFAPVFAQTGAPSSAAPVSAITPAGYSPGRGLRDRWELEAFVDGVMTAFLADKHVAGATVSVVKDGQLFFAKGYGFADFDRRKPVDPERTMFRIGSVSKLFTWTAVMQLVEQGKLDLDKDINEYLDFEIPATYPEPITLTHVLTHTPGFEEDSRDLFTEDPARIAPMSQWLPAHLPKRVRPPGTFSSYSNWATAAAGLIVERVSGMSWDDYIEKNILQPLGMTHTTGRQPLPEQFAEDMSVGYKWDQGRFEVKKWEIVTGAPAAGSMSASATDIARFMIAHLNDGVLGEARILGEATAQRMHTRIQGHDSRLPGFAHGFYEQSSNGLRIYGHGGDTQWFHSDLALIPSERVGVFVSYNTDTGGALTGPFVAAFLDHYYPEPLAPITPPAEAKANAGRFAGEYLFNRMNFTTYQKAFSLAQPIRIAAAEDGALLMASPFGATRFVQVDSLLFRDVATHSLLSFKTDERGRVTHGFMGAIPMMALDKQTGAASPRFHQLVLGIGLVMFVGILVAAVLRFFRRRNGTEPAATPAVAGGRRVMAIVALAQVVFALVLVSIGANVEALFRGPPMSLQLGLALPVLGLALTAVALWFGVKQWRRGEGSVWSRLRHSGAVLVALAFFWSLGTWNLLGWRS